MPNSRAIDFEELRVGYNRMYKTSYRTVKAFLYGIYKETPNLKKIAKILGVSHPVVRIEMTRLGLPRQKKGHRGLPNGLIKIKELDVHEMTCTEISKAIELSFQYTWWLLKEYKIKHKKRVV